MQEQWKVVYLPLLRLSPNAKASGKALMGDFGVLGRSGPCKCDEYGRFGPFLGPGSCDTSSAEPCVFVAQNTTLTYTHVTTRRITEIESPLDDLGLKTGMEILICGGYKGVVVH